MPTASYTAMTVNDVSIASWRPGTQRLILKTLADVADVVSAAGELAAAIWVALPGKRTS